jgi:hypothetical protein
VLSHVAPDMAAEKVAQPLPFGDPSRHLVETGLQRTDFGAEGKDTTVTEPLLRPFGEPQG